MQEDIFAHVGQVIKNARIESGLTQQDLADQVGRSIRYLQAIEAEKKNPSLEVLTDYVRRLGLSGNTIFYPDATEEEMECRQLMGKILACSKEDRKIIIKSSNYLADQFINKRYSVDDFDSSTEQNLQ